MKFIRLVQLFLLITLVPLSGCNENINPEITLSQKGSNNMSDNQAKISPNKSADLEWKMATIKYMDFEGGFFGIVTDKGEKLLPMNLSKDFRQVGAKIRVKGKLVNDMVTTQQWGQPFRIAEIKLIKAGKPLNDSKGIQY